jgi:hypothetical protein
MADDKLIRAADFIERYAETGFDVAKKHDCAIEAGLSKGNLNASINGAVRLVANNEKMQEALKAKGVDFDRLAEIISDKLTAKSPRFGRGGENLGEYDDHGVQLKAWELSVKALDAFPSAKIDISKTNSVEIHITHETAMRGLRAVEAQVIPIDDIKSEFVE